MTLGQFIDISGCKVIRKAPPRIFFDEDPQAIRLRGKAPSVAGIHRVLTPYGNRYTG